MFPFEIMKREGSSGLLMTASKVRIYETTLSKDAVSGRPGNAVEVSRDKGRHDICSKLRYTIENKFAALRAGKFAYMIQMSV